VRAQADRRGCGGKRRVVIDIVNRYWDEIEGDFRSYFNGLDAKQWFRVRLFPHTPEEISCYSWETFIRLAVYCTNIQGSALYDATLGDQDLIEEMYADLKEQQSSKRKPAASESPEIEERPPRRGYSREVEAIYDLIDNLVALRAEMGRWPQAQTARAFSKRPWFPGEVAQEKMRLRARRNVNRAIAAAQAHWLERQGNDDSAGSGT
jgi:hypothetical protein